MPLGSGDLLPALNAVYATGQRHVSADLERSEFRRRSEAFRAAHLALDCSCARLQVELASSGRLMADLSPISWPGAKRRVA